MIYRDIFEGEYVELSVQVNSDLLTSLKRRSVTSMREAVLQESQQQLCSSTTIIISCFAMGSAVGHPPVSLFFPCHCNKKPIFFSLTLLLSEGKNKVKGFTNMGKENVDHLLYTGKKNNSMQYLRGQ